MKIIKDNTVKQFTCAHCQSILEVSKKDIFQEYGEYSGVQYINDYFYCACCGEKNYVNIDLQE